MLIELYSLGVTAALSFHTKKLCSRLCQITTPENFTLKLCTNDYIKQILVSIGSVRVSPQIGETTVL